MKKDESKRRIRSPHPGVVLTSRTWESGRESFFARWFDPDTGKRVDTNLRRLGLTNADARRAWAIRKSKSMAARRADIEAGAALKTTTPLTKAYTDYLSARGAELSPNTIRNYKEALDPFFAWCDKMGIELVEAITPQLLSTFRDDHLRVTARAQTKGKGTGRGGKADSGRKRSPHTVNRVFRSLRTLLSYWRRRAITPSLNSDTIRDSLAFVRAEKPLPHFLSAAEVEKLLLACMDHDAKTFLVTRAEHAKGLQRGSTPRYMAITPIVYAALLTGARFDEMRTLRWTDVDLAQNAILIRADAVKTKTGRRVELSVSPTLSKMFQPMKDTGGLFVFGRKAPLPRSLIESARKRLILTFKAPEFTWHDLRRTCGTFLTCAPGIYGGASAFMSARRLGHSVAVAEKHYLGMVTGILPEARNLEAAMGIEALSKSVLKSIESRAKA